MLFLVISFIVELLLLNIYLYISEMYFYFCFGFKIDLKEIAYSILFLILALIVFEDSKRDYLYKLGWIRFQYLNNAGRMDSINPVSYEVERADEEPIIDEWKKEQWNASILALNEAKHSISMRKAKLLREWNETRSDFFKHQASERNPVAEIRAFFLEGWRHWVRWAMTGWGLLNVLKRLNISRILGILKFFSYHKKAYGLLSYIRICLRRIFYIA